MNAANLGILTYGLDRPIGGIGTYTRRLIEALRNAGRSPLLLNAGQALPGQRSAGLPASHRVPGLLTWGQVEVARAVRRHAIDLLHDPVGVYPFALARCRKVLTLHDAFPLVQPRTSATLEILIYRLWLPLAVRQADAVITVSQHSKRDILKFFPIPEHKVKVVTLTNNPHYRPMQPSEIQPALAKYQIAGPYILYVGSLEPRKNLVRLLKAYHQLTQWSSKWRLVIVGAKNYWKSTPVVETVSALGLERMVQFTGFVEEQDLPAIYNGADVFAFPSLYEGFGLPTLEAMACGIPVVTSNTSSLPEVVGDAALQVDPYDVEAICDALKRILSDSSLAAELKSRGLARASSFTWERMARETLAVYQEVLNS